MSLLVESIKILNGKIFKLALHNARVNRTRKEVFGLCNKIDLKKYIHVPDIFRNGLVKCRVTYDSEIRDTTFSHYQIRSIKKVKKVVVKDLVYNYKWENRAALDSLFAMRQHEDEILIIRDGLVTDGYYYNLVFERQGRYFTPKSPLFAGVQRESLLQKGKIIPTDIRGDEINLFDKIHYINALTPLGKIAISTLEVY